MSNLTLEQQAKELLDDLGAECKCEECITAVERHLTSFAQEAASAAAEAMREACIDACAVPLASSIRGPYENCQRAIREIVL